MNIKKSSANLKIGIVCYPSVGGSGIVATNLGLELARRGHEIHFISYDEPFLFASRQPKVFFHKVAINEYSLFKYPDYTLPLAVKIEQVQRQYDLDLVHVHYAIPHATAALLSRGIMLLNKVRRPKVITTLHGTDITLLAKDHSLLDIIRYSIERSDGVTAVSQSLKRETVKTLKPRKAIEVIYNFYTPKAVSVSRQAMRRRLGIRPDDFVAIHMSNLRDVKRVADLLKITARLKNNPRFKLLLLAGGNFDPYEQQVRALKLKAALIVRKNIQDIANYINASDIGLYTSDNESFGMGILETQSYGKPVLSTGVGGVPEVVKNGRTGFLFKVGDIEGFIRQAKRLMLDDNLRNKMGAEAKRVSCEKFCVEKIVPKYLDYYRKILAKK